MKISEKIYTGICTFFAIIVVLGNLTYQKFVSLPLFPFYTFELSVGAIIYPLAFLLSDLIAEFYGKEKASFCVRFAICMNVIAALIVTGMDYLNATSWSKIDNATFHKVFGAYGLSFISSMIACYTAQVVDISLYLLIKKCTQGKWLWLRNSGSTAISLLVDTSIVVGLLGVFGILPMERIGILIFNSYTFKLFFTICGIPFFYIFVWAIKRLLQHSSEHFT